MEEVKKYSYEDTVKTYIASAQAWADSFRDGMIENQNKEVRDEH